MPMKEIDFRIESLKKNKEKYDGKRIALYGVKDNAKRILEELTDQNIVALIDRNWIGKTIFNKSVISLESTLAQEIEVIIIAAEIKSSVIVSERILPFCREHQITLLNMYGTEEIYLQDAHKYQLCIEDKASVELIKERIKNNSVIYVQLTDVLCRSIYENEKELFAELENQNGLEAFAEGRIVAEEKCEQRLYCIDDIYDIYEMIMYPKTVNGKELYNSEEQLWINSFIPNAEMINLVNDAVRTGKRVYIVSDLKLPFRGTDKLLNALGLHENTVVLQENLCKRTFSHGALRPEEAEGGIEKVLYIGTDKGYNSRLALAYGMELVLVKGVQKTEQSDKISGVSDDTRFAEYPAPLVSVVVLSEGDNACTDICLKSIKKNTIYVEYEVIVQENGFEELPHIRGTYVVFLKSSCQVQYNWLAPMVHLMETDSETGLVGSKIISPDGCLLEAGGILWPDGSKESYGKGQNPDCPEYNYVKEVDYISGVSIMLRASLWKDISGLENRIKDFTGRETELAEEIRKREKKVVFQPASRVIYSGKSTVFMEADQTKSNVQRFSARDRKKAKKTIVFFSYDVPTPDCDAGSVTIFLKVLLGALSITVRC